MHKDRFKPTCEICEVKGGACIQCAFGRCVKAFHPICCVLKDENNPSGNTYRIIKAEDGDGLEWEMFCRAHAYAVNNPNKYKSKAKRSTFRLSAKDETDETSDPNPNTSLKNRRNKGGKTSKRGTNKTPRGGEGEEDGDEDFIGDEDDEWKSVSSNSKGNRGRRKSESGTTEQGRKQNRIQQQQRKGSKSKSNNSVQLSKQPRSGLNGSQEMQASDEDNVQSLDGDEQRQEDPDSDEDNDEGVSTYQVGPRRSGSSNIWTMSEWPGQAVGEGLDLTHFWNVASMMYPEDHDEQVRCVRRVPYTAMSRKYT